MSESEQLQQLRRFIEAQQARGGLVLLAIAAFGALSGFAAIALVLVTLQQVREVTQIAVASEARIEALEKTQAGLDAFVAESRTRLINIELMQNYTADSFEKILTALHVAPTERPKLQPHEWPRPEPKPPPESAPPAPPKAEPETAPAPAEEKRPWWRFWD